LILIEYKTSQMKKLGNKNLTLHLQEPLAQIPAGLSDWRLALKNGGGELEYTFDASESRVDIASLLRRMGELGIVYKDLNTSQSSLEDIFVSLVSERA
ncbi:MAG: multidrug ABC transporter ATP-binding protein, partial [Burkholderiales bacterium]